MISHSNLCVCVLASGSRGNSIFISDNDTSLLIDAGLSGIEIQRRLESRGLSPESLKGILVSHEHSDHISGVGVIARRFNLPVYISRQTYYACSSKLGKLENIIHFEPGQSFFINSIEIHPFTLSHDATDTTGFTLKKNDKKVGIATDLGIATSLVKNHLQNCSLLIIESNHDPEMLTNGSYPWPLKQRIKSRSGHLSNTDTQHLLKELIHENLSHIILGHLSQENNTPQIAFNSINKILNNNIKLFVASQDTAGELIQL